MRGDLHPPVPQGWRLLDFIGSGSCGSVYRVVREHDGARAVLKVISIPMDENEIPKLRANGCNDETISRIFEDRLTEIFDKYEIVSKMNGEPNIVSVDNVLYRRFSGGNGCYIFVLEEELTPLCTTLDHHFSEQRAIAIAEDILRALKSYAQYRLVHGAVKPENVLVSEDGTYKLSDFGVSGLLSDRAVEIVGDACDFMAPEVFLGKPYDSRADVYSVGLLLYWLCNDYRMPFLPDGNALSNEQFEEAVARRMSGGTIPQPQNGSDRLHTVIAKACAYDPNERYASAAAMLGELRNTVERRATALPLTPIRIPQQTQERPYSEPVIRERRPVANKTPVRSAEPGDDEAISLFEDDFVEKRRTNREQKETKKKKTNRKLLFAAAVFGLVLIAGLSFAIAMIVLFKDEDKRDETGKKTAQETIIPRPTVSFAPETIPPEIVVPGQVTPAAYGSETPLHETPENDYTLKPEDVTPTPATPTPTTPTPITPKPTPIEVPPVQPAHDADYIHQFDGKKAQVAYYDKGCLNPGPYDFFDDVEEELISEENLIARNTKVTIHAWEDGYALVQTQDGRVGWIDVNYLYAEWMNDSIFNIALNTQVTDGLELPKNLEMYGTFEHKLSKDKTNIRYNPYVAEKMDPPEPSNKIDQVGKNQRFTILARRTVDSKRWYFCLMETGYDKSPIFCWVSGSNFQ